MIEAKNNLVIFSAFEEDKRDPIAMSICVHSKDNLWGRYWGAYKNINNLHFELCYYKPIEWAIKNQVKSFDPGAGGKHKRRRGFYAKKTISMHKWFDNRMAKILEDWLHKINPIIQEDIERENKSIPFKLI